MFESLYYNPIENEGWSNVTIYLYLFIVLSAFMGGYLSQHIKISTITFQETTYKNKRLNFTYVALVFIILFFFSAFRKVGSDYPTYEEIFNNSLSGGILDYGIEPGFIFYNQFVRSFTNSSYFFFAFSSFLTISLVFSTIIHYSSRLELSIALGAYASLFYFQSYSLMRIYLASAFMLYCFKTLYERKFVLYITCIFVVATIHASTLFLLYPLLLLYIYRKNHLICYLFLLLTLLFCYKFSDYLLLFNISERYTEYLNNMDNEVGLGIGQIIFNVPLLILLARARKLKLDSWLLDIFTVFVYSNFLFGILGYWIPTIGRATILFSPPFILFLPYYLKEMRNKKNYKITFLFVIIYLFFRLHMYFLGYLYSDCLMPYKTIFSN